MLKINKNYAELKTNYLFSEIARKVAEYSKQHPEKEIIRMGIGDVTRPLCEEVVEGLKSAAESMGVAETIVRRNLESPSDQAALIDRMVEEAKSAKLN